MMFGSVGKQSGESVESKWFDRWQQRFDVVAYTQTDTLGDSNELGAESDVRS